jgi:hypothetical protein
MRLRDTLKMMHENHVNGSSANCAEDRERTGGEPFRHDDAEARGELAHKRGSCHPLAEPMSIHRLREDQFVLS